MSKVQTLLIPALAGALFLLSAAVELPSSPLVLISGGKGKQTAPAPEKREHSSVGPAQGRLPRPLTAGDAGAVLHRAVASYSPEKVAWLELTLWQRAVLGEVDYEMEGRFLAAPNQRLRLELGLQAGPVAGKLVLVSDGQSLRESLHLQGTPVRTTILPLPQIQDATDNPAVIAQQREALLNTRSFRGIGPLLVQIQQNLRQPRLAGCTWQGKDVLEIRGKWELGEQSFQNLPSDLRPGQVVRECRLYLDAATYWPVRIEWWGSPAPGQSQVRLVETEYRHPVVNQPFTPERMMREFSVVEQGVVRGQ